MAEIFTAQCRNRHQPVSAQPDDGGEKIEDLRPFDPDLVARVIAGLA